MNDSTKSTLPKRIAPHLAFALLLLFSGCEQREGEAKLERFQVLHEQGRYRETVGALRERVDLNPANMEANLLLGTALFHSGDAGLAVWPLRRASEDPRFAVTASLLLARAMLDSRTAPDALPVINRVLEL